MGFKGIKRLNWKWWGYCCYLLLGLGHVEGQSVAETLRAGQPLKLEWIQQDLGEQGGRAARTTPLFPDELQPGESELRVGLQLQYDKATKGITAEVSYLTLLTLPELEDNPYVDSKKEVFTQAVIRDTRFQDEYFDPQLFLLEALVQKQLPVACQEKPYQQLFEVIDQQVKQSGLAQALLEAQIAWLRETDFPAALSSSSLASFFCQLLELPVPERESPVQIQTRRDGQGHRVDFVQVDHPARQCRLQGTIRNPATEQVRITYFRQGDWLTYWQDSLVPLDRDGNFHFSFPLDQARIISFSHGYQTMRFYFEPGDTIQLQTNGNAFYRESQLSGNDPADNQFLLDFYREMRGDTFFRRSDFDLLEKEPIAHFHRLQAKEKQELAFLAARATTLRPGFAALMDRILKLEHANTQWEAAYWFMQGKGFFPGPELLHQLQAKASLLYQLPPGKSFAFDVEEYLSFQYYLLNNAYQRPGLGGKEDWLMAKLLPSKQTFVRHAVMQLFRSYSDLGELTESGQSRLEELLAMTRDTQLRNEMRVFATAQQSLPKTGGIRVLFAGKKAPAWSYPDQEGRPVELKDYAGQKLLLHIGRAENLDDAMRDLELFGKTADDPPGVVHLLTAASKQQFDRQVLGKQGVFLFVSPAELETLKENYFVDNKSNHYFLIGEDGKILVNHYELTTTKKLRGAWKKVAPIKPETTWTPEQRIRFWRLLGIGALSLLLISGLVVWRRRLQALREQRRRQLLEIELRGIRSQMNPHFLFNAMSAIQNLIRKKEQDKADIYLGEFAGLMRKTLRNSAEAYIPLTDEMEALEQYCSLESLRQPFQYTFQIDERIDAYNTYIPSMLLQPIIENAIIHGLAPRAEGRELLVDIGPGAEGLACTIKDNGIGIVATKTRNQKRKHQSMGMKLVRERLELMGLSQPAHLTITDRSTLHPPAQGTIVS
ncbi:MAG: histidine kinase, partial [Bacteroidota bacterium]